MIHTWPYLQQRLQPRPSLDQIRLRSLIEKVERPSSIPQSIVSVQAQTLSNDFRSQSLETIHWEGAQTQESELLQLREPLKHKLVVVICRHPHQDHIKYSDLVTNPRPSGCWRILH